MSRNYFTGLNAKLNLLLISVIILTAVVISGYVVQERLQNSYTQLQQNGLDLAKMVASVSEFGIYTENVPTLNGLIESLAKYENNAYISIFNKERQVLLSKSFKPEFEQYTSSISELAWQAETVNVKNLLDTELKMSAIDIVVPVVSMSEMAGEDPLHNIFAPVGGDEIIGFIQLGLDQTQMRKGVDDFLWSMIVLTSKIVIIGILLSALLTRRAVAPMKKLVEATKNVARGDFEQKVISKSKDEIGDLARAYNVMIDRLKDYQVKVNEHQNTLEQKVLQRTEELEATTQKAQKLAHKAEQANRAKSEFLATMSHEIRTPMNGVLGMIELLLGSNLSDQQQRFAETVRRSGETLLGIINDILDFSKIEAGKLSLEKVNFNLRDLVEDLGEVFSVRAHGKGLELACHVPANIPEAISGDPTRLRQILTNLVGNAIKFTETGEILMSVLPLEETATTARLRFAIRDTGIGLEASQIERIFDSFSQGDGSTTRKYGGTGLGLAISRQLVGLMGGQLNVESVGGEGSTFAFEIVLDKQQNPQATLATKPVEDFANLHVLVVDDNVTNLEILSHHLKAWNITHTCAESGASALQLLHGAVRANNPYNMAILDYHMPEMDGLELARMINSDPLYASIRMVMFSSVDDVVLQRNSQELGIDYSIAKPVRQSELYDCLNNKNVAANRSALREKNDENSLLLQDPSLLKILVVEDNEVNQAVAIGMLKQLGYRGIHKANDGREALDKVALNCYDLILMDMQMPVMDGYQATAALRQREQALTAESIGGAIPHMPIIALTANAMQGDREHCLAAGVDDYLSKPFTPVDLRNVLEKWLPGIDTDLTAGAATTVAESTALNPTDTGSGTETRQPDQPIESVSSSIDQAVLDVIRDMEDEDDPDMLAEIIGLYLNQAPELLQAQQTAIVNEDAESLRIAAHTLKSSSANVGARVLADLCRELEELGRAGSLDNAANKLALSYEEFRKVNLALSHELKRNAA